MTAEPQDAATPLDELLTQASVGVVRRLAPPGPGSRFLGALARRPQLVAGRLGSLAEEVRQITLGSSDIAPARGDRRFADPAWMQNPVLRRLVQTYLAASETAEGLVQDVPLEWSDAERVRFAVENLVNAASPSNNPLISPVAWKAAIDSGGANLVTGPRNLVRDLSHAPRVPSMVDPDAFQVGVDLAVTPGSVVYRAEMFELIQYRPQTEMVRELPLLIIPPTINKYYVLDLAPGRSIIEYLVQQGQQVFVLSWRNPDARHRGWGIDAYAEGILDAFDAVDRITGAGSAHVVAACSGGLLACATAAQRSATGQVSRLASLSLLVTMIDQSQAGVPAAIISESLADQAIAKSAQKGYLDGRSLAEMFAWLRPNDLIWNYWVNNYLQGRTPPKFDVLFWNADTTRMSAALHRDFVDAALHNKLARPGELTVLGTPIDLSKITVDSYVVAGSADHICPWMNCYRSSQLLGGKVRFVLSTNGHVAALVNPPGNPKSSFQVMDDNSLDADGWLQAAQREQGSWWPDYARWLGDRSGSEKPAPASLGSDEFPIIEEAPGSYVREK